MGTRGLWGFVLDGQPKVSYNHFDSYPDGLGTTLANWLATADLDEVREQVKALDMVTDEEDEPPEDVKERLAKFADTRVGSQGWDNTEVKTWYQLLRNCQGDPVATLESGCMIDSFGFGFDSLFCEWGWVIDLDRGVLDVYQGFQNQTTESGLWSSGMVDNGYGPIRPEREIPLDALRGKSEQEIIELMRLIDDTGEEED